MKEYLSVSEYAYIEKKDVGNIRRLLISGRLPGIKIGNQWVIEKGTPYPTDLRYKNGLYVNQRAKNKFYKNKPIVTNILCLVKELENIYGNDAKAVVLYGSYARGQESPESDIDIAIFVNKSSKKNRDLMIEAVSKYELLSNKVISAVEIEVSQYENWKESMPFYKNIKKEGIILWER